MSFDIRALRINRKIRQRDLAKNIGISLYHLRKWERGLELPNRNAISKLCKLFHIKNNVLLENQSSYIKSVTHGEGYITRRENKSSFIYPKKKLPTKLLRVVDLFSGCGGLSFGLEMTGHFGVIFGNDLLHDRVRTFCSNHQYATGFVGDIRGNKIEEISNISKSVDIIVGGPPCQGFSSIRPFRTLTEGDRRNELIEHYVMAVKELKPKWFLFENVVGVLTHNNGIVLNSLLDNFRNLGYDVSWRVVNSALYGVPQNRERLIIIGNCLGLNFSWPKPSHFSDYKSMAGSRNEVIYTSRLYSAQLKSAVTVMDAISDLPAVKAGEEINYYNSEANNDFQRSMRKGCRDLTLHRATKHKKKMLEIISHSGLNINSIPKNLIKSGFSSCYSRLEQNKPSTTLTVNFVHPASNRCIHPLQDRALTIREGARIQSFPDQFVFCGTPTQIVKQIGNAVPPLLAKAIGKAIYKAHKSKYN